MQEISFSILGRQLRPEVKNRDKAAQEFRERNLQALLNDAKTATRNFLKNNRELALVSVVQDAAFAKGPQFCSYWCMTGCSPGEP